MRVLFNFLVFSILTIQLIKTDKTTLSECLEKEDSTIANTSKENYASKVHVFLRNRLSCLQCKGSDCANLTNILEFAYSCENYTQNDQCYSIFAPDGSFAYRGCMSDNSPGKDFCLEHPKQCRKCSTRSCNNDPIIWGKTLACLKCNSRDNENCDTLTDNIESVECASIVSSYENYCFTHTNESHVERGCLFEAQEDIQNNCYNSTDKSCSLCNESNCNHEKKDYVGEYCFQCDSKVDLNCTENLGPYMEKKCGSSRKGCYLIRKSQHVNNLPQSLLNLYKHFYHVRRGCASDLTNEEYVNCLSTFDSSSCKLCHGDNCNKKVNPQQCVRCNSETDERCLISPTTAPTAECSNYIDQCITIAHANKTIVRGCKQNFKFTEEYCVKNPWLCTTCDTDNCNTMISTDKFCYACDSKKNPNCINNIDETMISNCEYSENQGCYHFINSTDSSVLRGCMANLENPTICKSNGENCKFCMENQCNSRDHFAQCNTNNEVIGNKIRGSDSKICEDYNDKCFLHVDKDSVKRGCLFEHMKANDIIENSNETQVNPSMFKTCSTPICNDDVIEIEICISCDSQDPNCKNNVTSKMSKKCNLAPESMGCYHYEENDEVKRGCISEIDDTDFRELCESNSDQCKKCIGNECNSRQMAFQRCFVNDHSNPQRTDVIMLESKICTNYMDECYTHVANDIVRRGCMSDVVEGVDLQTDCKDSDICEKCSETTNCNNKEIQTDFCSVCNSVSQQLCKGAPQPSWRKRCPLSIRPFGCYLNQNKTHFVERGCMSTDSKLRKICMTESETCKYCSGDECNRKIDFERCIHCNSDEDEENCKTKAWRIDRKICKHYMDECFTYVNDGLVTRGCLSEFTSDKDNCTNKDTCRRCSNESGCNTVPIRTESCISCDSKNDSNCKSNVTLENAEICPQKTIQLLGCFHFIDETNGHTKRGCVTNLSTDDRRFASKQQNQWKYCFGNDNCNSRATFSKCFYCNSQIDPDCISSPTVSSSSIKLCDEYDDSCFSFIRSHSVVRGCLNELEWESIVKCHRSPEKCDICKSENGKICNNKSFSASKCISCDSKKDERCRSQPELLSQKLCGLVDAPEEDLGCYLIHNKNNRVNRGCVSDLTVQLRDLCWNKTDQCRICNGNNCNKKVDFQHCYECTSKENSSCVQSDLLDAIKICPNYMDQCLTALDSDGFTVRTCFTNDTTEMTKLEQFPMHEVCEESRCNGDIFPDNRMHCFQCDGDQTCENLKINENETLKATPCKMYSKYDKCFVFMDEDQNLYRGCMTDVKESRLLCEQNPDKCLICGENGCNNRTMFIEPELSCFTCKDSTDCAFGQVDRGKLVNCTQLVEFGNEESCFIQSHFDGAIERGCTLDKTDAEPNWCDALEGCSECTGDGCNDENIYFGYCLQCDSLNDKNCESPIIGSNEFYIQCAPIRYEEFEENHNNDSYNLNNTVKELSYYEPYPFSKRGCYSLKQDGVVERGCISDMTDGEHEGCKGAKWCDICEKEYCNDKQFKIIAMINAATKLPSYNLFIILIILITIHLQ